MTDTTDTTDVSVRTEDEQAIRALVERWAEAVHAGELDTVLDQHADDIVMFDVPPPDDGVRGIGAYREPGPASSSGRPTGASFELVELDVTAGADVAYACGAAALCDRRASRRDPDTRLRLTLGLRKEDGRWVVAHEHHSFPDRSEVA